MKLFALFSSLLFLAASACSQAIPENNSASHKNLTIFLIKGKDKVNRSYSTLEEAMERGEIVMHETGDVNSLAVDNKSDKYIFIMAGDIVKGGKQDRTIAEDIVLKPKSKNIPLSSFCVEQSRWRQRGEENEKDFSVSKKTLSNKNLKIAARENKSQQDVWSSVAEFQETASKNLQAEVRSKVSASSLQLTLESDTLKAAVKEYIDDLKPLFEKDKDILGFAFCVNGKISTVDIFGNAELFGKLRDKLLEAAANEAVYQYDKKLKFDVPTRADIEQFIARAEKEGEETVRKTGENTTERKRKTIKTIMFSTFDVDAGTSPVHISIYSTEDTNLGENQKNINQSQYRYGGFNRNSR
ncbi:MAG: hypothetical protein LBC98_04565 [Prevotellaceae bacterium]|jgi:hypothetical protein|nr:hypothetical protein [Prevotellaceae bacterium]